MTRMEDQSPKKRINISITEETYNLLKGQAFQKNTTMSQLIADWIWTEEELNGQVRINRDWVKELDIDTLERLLQFSYENHTSPAQAITNWIWKAKVKNTNIRGQLSLCE